MSEIICETLTILKHEVILLARTAAKLVCYFKIKSWAKAIFLGTPKTAITAIADQLGDAGASINADDALNAINDQVEGIIPQLAVLKSSKNVALTEITEVHPIDKISLSVGIEITENNELGSAKIDGIGFRIEATKED
ncbi:MAG: hypothetical protein MK066_03470 [Crocinitomicaceae bacterium]|nr:hypothetical protein [Crocinitomicaceae bacterium]